MLFLGYELKEYLVRALQDLKFKEFSTVQKEVFDNLKSKKNLIVTSKTGTGKTHAFLIPIFNNLDEKKKVTQAVIVTPTTELALQIQKMSQHLASFSSDTIVIKAFYGGTDMQREMERIASNPPQIVIATPGKLRDLAIEENVLKIHEAEYFVLDEVDMIADSFLEDAFIVSEKCANATKMVFSATIREGLEALLKKFLTNAVMIEATQKNTTSLKIEHYLIPVKYRDKDQLLLSLTKAINPYLAIIFANKKETVTRLYAFLKNNGINAVMLHGDLNVRERKRIVNEINALKYQYIIASDMLARGIDIVGVSHIINYELPRDFEFYIHRSGRTGRMYMDGVSYSFYDEENNTYLDNLAKKHISFNYLDIKNGELVPYKARNERSKRIKPLTDEEKKAKIFIKKPKKVTPGYKKKMEKQQEALAKKLKKGGRK